MDHAASSPDPSVAALYYKRSRVWSDIQGHMDFLFDVASVTEGNIVELGVRDGNSTSALIAGLSVLGRGHLWSVDTEAIELPEAWVATGRWTVIRGDDREVAHLLPDDIDVLFIDTSHHYHHTLEELRLYGDKAKRILMHDTELEWPWMTPPGDPAFPVRKAIETWLDEHPNRQVEWREGSYGMAVIT